MTPDDYQFDLPEALIAQEPLVERSAPADLLAPATGADWLVVLPTEFEGSLRLADLRRDPEGILLTL